jgi:hypothetical protein
VLKRRLWMHAPCSSVARPAGLAFCRVDSAFLLAWGIRQCSFWLPRRVPVSGSGTQRVPVDGYSEQLVAEASFGGLARARLALASSTCAPGLERSRPSNPLGPGLDTDGALLGAAAWQQAPLEAMGKATKLGLGRGGGHSGWSWSPLATGCCPHSMVAGHL